VLAIASGKGGVGKSSVTVNLAVALAQRGLTVGILDADIWVSRYPASWDGGRGRGPPGQDDPLEKPVGSGLVRVLSMGFLADEEQAIMWRGLKLNRAVQQFLQDAHWGDLDYLLIDLPPGPAMSRWAWPACSRGPRCWWSPRHPWRPRRWRHEPPIWPERATSGSPGSSRT